MKISLTVFVCGTYSDLMKEREAVLQAIRKLQYQHDSMEFFGARTDVPIETCLEEVRKSDVLVVIVGHRYGSLVAHMGISFSEAEYREGYRLGKPCLVYVRDENVPVLPKHMERDPAKISLLDKFKNTLRIRHTVAAFKDPHDLSVSVAADLSRTAQALEETARVEERMHKAPTPISKEINGIIKQALNTGVDESLITSTIRNAVVTLLRTEGVRKPLVFFSYSYRDKEIVRAIASGLKSEGIDVWIDEQDIEFGDRILEAISERLDSADLLAFFMSKNSLSSPWSRLELNVMMSRRLSKKGGAIILPILLDSVEIPALLRDVKYLDLRDYARGDIRKGIKELSKAIRHLLKARKIEE